LVAVFTIEGSGAASAGGSLAGDPDNRPRNVLSVLPLSHALALIGLCHVCVYRGDGLVTLQGFDLHDTLAANEKHEVNILWMVSQEAIFPNALFLWRGQLTLTYKGSTSHCCNNPRSLHSQDV
jgi:acyl-CoA synthetase (AMP-forming)/AMP-acid ligase II